MCKYDSEADTRKHIAMVRQNLSVFIKELIDRGDHHDDSKLSGDEKATFDEMTPKLKDCTYGSPEYAGKYLDRPETPVFIGGMAQYIEFDEVISKSATETAYGSQPLGDIAAIGRGGKPLNNGHIHYQCEEPGYIMGLMAITPMVDYSQGNDFDLNLQTIDDLHKPALDGIGYQDLIQEQMVGETSNYDGGGSIQNIVTGKQIGRAHV